LSPNISSPFSLYTFSPLPYTSPTLKGKLLHEKNRSLYQYEKMGKTEKGPTPDPAVKDKQLDQILAEIRAAQSQGTPPGEVLKKISFYLQEEPYLTIALIEALIRIPNPETAQLLTAMMAESEEKQVTKAIKRTLYKLRQKGVRWEGKPADEKPLFTPPKPAELEGYLSSIDSTSSRILIIARPIPQKGLLVVFSIVSDIEGIQQFTVNRFSKKDFTEFLKTSLSSEDFPVIQAPGAYCFQLLKEAGALTKSLSKALPQGFHEVESAFKDVSWDELAPLIYQFIKEDEIKDLPHLLKDSAHLHETMPFSTWHLEEQEVKKYASQITEAQQSKIVLRPDQKEARVNAIYREALEELFPEEKRLRWKRRLEETAYVLLKTGKEDEARAALSAAIDLKNPLSPIEPNPFIWNLVLKSIQALIQTDQEKKEEQKKTSLIITP
jgi:hypothetical protein